MDILTIIPWQLVPIELFQLILTHADFLTQIIIGEIQMKKN